jgi:exopolysaccharide biosynthesis predicted pyruvyltransferase EpsI
MPQSVFYALNSTADQAAFATEQMFWGKKAPLLPGKMIVSCRQHDSCDFLAKHFPTLEIRRVPDMAFMIPPIYDILFLVRRDQESVAGHEQNLKVIKETLKGGGATYEVHDWHQIGSFLPIHARGKVSADPSLKTQGGAEGLSRGKIIVTDRLHGSILSLLRQVSRVFLQYLQQGRRESENGVDTRVVRRRECPRI